MEVGYGHFVCSFWRLMEGDKTNKRQNEISFLRFGDFYNATNKTKWPQNLILSRCLRLFVLSRCTSRQNEEMEFHFFVSSFCRVGQGAKTNKRQNAKTRFHFFVYSFCRVVQVAKTKKRNFISSYLCFVALVKATKRTNDRTQKQHFISSFVRFVASYKSPKRRNGISFLRFFVLSPSLKHEGTTKRQSYREISKFDLSWLLVRFVVCSFCRLPQGANMTERQRDKMKFCGHFVLSFIGFVALYKSPKRRNEISFWRLFVLSPSIRRQNEQTKWPYPASIQDR